VSETPDWKQRYRDSVLEMETEERRWRQVEQALRRLVGRLCAAGMGVDPQLDDELKALAAANRRNAAAEELEKLAASLTSVVVAVDAVAPVANTGTTLTALRYMRWDSTCAAVGGVLQHLKSVNPDNPAAERLFADLPEAGSDAELAVIVQKTADLIRELTASYAHERLKSAAVLSQVTLRLGEMAGYLAEAGEAARTGFDDSTGMSETVMSQVRELGAEVGNATELSVLQSQVSARLETVTRQVLDFRDREDARRQEQANRAERMFARIGDLEREAEELSGQLDREKHSARLDPLTRLANRKSFDERMADELLNLEMSGAPVAMLLWDIDDFKIINDSYGHRAGDRVLKTVAACFVSGLRTEDFVARIGGEEFVVLMPGVAPEAAQSIANELRTAVTQLRFHFRGTPIIVTASCGITQLRRGDGPDAAFDRADGALYRAKREGKNLCIAA